MDERMPQSKYVSLRSKSALSSHHLNSKLALPRVQKRWFTASDHHIGHMGLQRVVRTPVQTVLVGLLAGPAVNYSLIPQKSTENSFGTPLMVLSTLPMPFEDQSGPTILFPEAIVASKGP